MASSKAALMDAFTCIWVASVNQMVLIPKHMCLVKCPLGSSEHLMGVSSICIEEIHLPVARKNECIFLCTKPSPWLWGGQRDVGFKQKLACWSMLICGLCYPDEPLGWNHRIRMTPGSLFSRLHQSLYLESQKFRAGRDLTNEHRTLYEKSKVKSS